MFYLVYKVTNLVNGKFYIGAHKTDNKNDDYMGSGKLIKRAIKKYGIENFKKEIILECESQEEMYRIEAEMVVLCEDSYNLKFGGQGGWDYCNINGINKGKSEEDIASRRIKYENTMKNKYGDNWKKELSKLMESKRTTETIEKISETMRLRYKDDEYFESLLNDKIKLMNSPESIEKKKKTFKDIGHQIGEKNSSYGTCWISHSEIGSRKCKLELLPEFIDQGWIKGRNIFKVG